MKWFLVIWISLYAVESWAVPLELKYGVNELDINGDGTKDMIVRTRWENFNAHSFDRYLVMVRLEGVDYPQRVYEVPLGRNYDYTFRTEEAADCALAAYRFELNSDHLLKVTVFTKPRGQETFCAPTYVTVATYLLTDGVKEDGMTAWGTPPYYLKEVGKRKSSRKHESVYDVMN